MMNLPFLNEEESVAWNATLVSDSQPDGPLEIAMARWIVLAKAIRRMYNVESDIRAGYLAAMTKKETIKYIRSAIPVTGEDDLWLVIHRQIDVLLEVARRIHGNTEKPREL